MKFLEQLKKMADGETIIIDYSLIEAGDYAAKPVEVKHEPDAVNINKQKSARITIKYELTQEGISKGYFTKAEYYEWMMDESRDLTMRTKMLTQLVAKLFSFGILNTKFADEIENYVGDSGFIAIPENLSSIIETCLSTNYIEKNIKMRIVEDAEGRKSNDFKIQE